MHVTAFSLGGGVFSGHGVYREFCCYKCADSTTDGSSWCLVKHDEDVCLLSEWLVINASCCSCHQAVESCIEMKMTDCLTLVCLCRWRPHSVSVYWRVVCKQFLCNLLQRIHTQYNSTLVEQNKYLLIIFLRYVRAVNLWNTFSEVYKLANNSNIKDQQTLSFYKLVTKLPLLSYTLPGSVLWNDS